MERWLNWMERRWGHLAVRHIAFFLIAPKILFFLGQAQGSGALESALIPFLVIENGEWLRVLTFVCVPTTSAPLWFLLYAYLTFMFCNAIEQQWGALRLNIYILISWLLTAVTPFIVYFLSSSGGPGSSILVVTFAVGEGTIFLAFAALYPNFTLRLFFILPVKVKYLAMLAWAGLFFKIWDTPTWGGKIVIAAVLANYFLFFGPSHFRVAKRNVESRQRRQKWDKAMRPDDD